jgi:hypothetical protein
MITLPDASTTWAPAGTVISARRSDGDDASFLDHQRPILDFGTADGDQMRPLKGDRAGLGAGR